MDMADVTTQLALSLAAIGTVGAALLAPAALRSAWNAVRGFIK